jgi:general secretion pathway protein D
MALAGCQPGPQATTVSPAPANRTPPSVELDLKSFGTEPVDRPNQISADLAERNESVAPITLPQTGAAETAREIVLLKPSTKATAETTDTASAKTTVRTLGNIGREGRNVVAGEQSPSPTRVDVPILREPGMADELISVNFPQVDIGIMLKTIGDITGINFVIDENVRGTVTVISPTKIRLGDVYSFLESILEVRGYAMVPTEGLVKVVPRAEALRRNLQVRIGSNPLEIPQNDSLVTQIIPLSYADATEVSQVVQPLLAVGSHLAVYTRTNSIMITDTSSNIHHIARIIQELDVPGSKEQVTVIGLGYASAELLSEQLMRIMQKSRLAPAPARAGRAAARVETAIKIMPDPRTNSLVVVANTQDTETIRRLAVQLDIERPRRTNNVHVVYLKNAPAEETSKSLSAALANLRLSIGLEAAGNVQVTADEGTNALIITASAQDFEIIAQIIEKLDIVREQVLVEMLIVEVSEDGLKEIGIDWATLDEAVAGSVRAFGATNFGLRSGFTSGTLEGLSVGAWKKNGSTTTIGPILHALEKISGVNILSTPHITTSNHQRAQVIVGENRAFVIAERITETDPSTPTVIRTFEYKDVGITLDITPHISQGGLVRLEIDTMFTKVLESATTLSIEAPTTAKRQAQTVVSLNNGSTVVIAGLIRDDKVTLVKKIPLLGDIPLIGGLFRFTRDQLQKTNLLLFITPHILTSQLDMEQATERKRQEMERAVGNLEKGSGRQ